MAATIKQTENSREVSEASPERPQTTVGHTEASRRAYEDLMADILKNVSYLHHSLQMDCIIAGNRWRLAAQGFWRDLENLKEKYDSFYDEYPDANYVTHRVVHNHDTPEMKESDG